MYHNVMPNGILLLITYAQNAPNKRPADVPRGLKFGLSLHLRPYFEHASSRTQFELRQNLCLSVCLSQQKYMSSHRSRTQFEMRPNLCLSLSLEHICAAPNLFDEGHLCRAKASI